MVPVLKPLYDYAWFVGFGASAPSHLVLMKLFSRRSRPRWWKPKRRKNTHGPRRSVVVHPAALSLSDEPSAFGSATRGFFDLLLPDYQVDRVR